MVQLIEIACECGKLLRVPRWRGGQKGKCTSCDRPVSVPILQLPPDVQEKVYQQPAPQLSEPLPESVTCPNCGQPNPAGSYSCNWCGQNWGDTPAMSPDMQMQALFGMEQTAPEEAAMPRRRSRTKKVLLLLLLMAPLAVCGVAYFNSPVFRQKLLSHFAPTVADTNKPDPVEEKTKNIPGPWYASFVKAMQQLEDILQRPALKNALQEIDAVKEIRFRIGRMKGYRSELEELAQKLAKAKMQGRDIGPWLAQKKADPATKEALAQTALFAENGTVEVALASLEKDVAQLEKEALANGVKKDTVNKIAQVLRSIHQQYDGKRKNVSTVVKEYLGG